MSYLASKPEQSDENEVALLQSLDALAVSSDTQAVRKSSATTVANVEVGSGGASGHTIKNAGTALTTRTGLNFLSPLVATDDAGGDESEITMTALSGDVTTTSGNVATLKANLKADSIKITLDGQGGVISTGLKGFTEVPYAGTITGWTILGDQTGSIVLDIWADSYANFAPTVADTITGSEKPTLSSAQKNQDLTLTTWTTAVTANTILGINVDSATTITKCTLIIYITKT